ncbi:MAG TPA: cation diffusion facilitator family transporter, partial [Dehalococcoidia bacterium]|nr:cation diffusion facilitator family transporter [Dehalococcoidia bacterium]
MKLGLENAAARAAGLSVLLSAVLMVAKIVVGLTQDSVAVLSDGLDSGQDLFAAALVLVSIEIGSRPADPGHPYGHGRAETVAATLQAILIGGAGLYVLARAVTRLLDPPPAIGMEISLATMAMSLASNLALVQYTSKVARSTGSPALEAEARHLRTNVAQAAAIIIGLVLVEATGEIGFDPLVAIGLAAYLTWTAGRILWAALQDVLDTSLPAREVQQ